MTRLLSRVNGYHVRAWIVVLMLVFLPLVIAIVPTVYALKECLVVTFVAFFGSGYMCKGEETGHEIILQRVMLHSVVSMAGCLVVFLWNVPLPRELAGVGELVFGPAFMLLMYNAFLLFEFNDLLSE